MSDTRAYDDVPSPPAAEAHGVARAGASSARCRNCGADASGLYCPQCGQETRIALPTVRELMRDAAGRLVALDGRLWRTLYVLMFRPGMLTREYLHGRRKRYVRPARLFFIMSLLLVAAIRLLLPPTNIISLDITDDKPSAAAVSPDAPASPAVASAAGDSAAHTATVPVDPEFDRLVADYGKYLPSDTRKRIERFKYLSTEEQADHVYSGLMRYAPYGMVALLPAFALLQYLSYLPGRRRHPLRPQRYAEHLVYGAHLHAFAFLMLIAMMIVPFKILRVALALWILVYVVRARQKIYGGSWLAGLLRSVAVALVYLMLLGVVMAALLALSIATR